MESNLCVTLAMLSSFLPLAALGQEPPELKQRQEQTQSDDARKAEPPRENGLPKPLDRVISNIEDIEKSGYFEIVKAEYGRTDMDNEEALVWTLRTVKTITARHACWLVQHYRDVRFYHTPANSHQEVLTKLMYFSEHLLDDAIDNRNLKQDDEFKLWIPLSTEEIRLLQGRMADEAVFREFRGP